MKESLANAMAEAANELGIDIDINETYSGRSIYGQTTHGVILDNFNALLMIVAIIGRDLLNSDDKDSYEEILRDLKRLRSDNIGHSLIYY